MEESNEGVKLVGFWVSPFVQRVKWCMKIKGVEYEYIEEDIYNKSPLLSHLNPLTRKVPVLLHHGNPLPESPLIIEYLDEIWRHNPLLPSDAYGRAQARFWAKFADQKVLKSAWLALCSEGANQDKAMQFAISHLEQLEEQLGGSRFFFGDDTIGYVDIMMGFIAYMLPVWEEVAIVTFFDDLKFPNLAAWKNNFLDHPIIKSDLPSKDEMFTYFQWRRKELIPVYAAYGEEIWSSFVI